MSKVLLQTNFGDITIELNHQKAPITATLNHKVVNYTVKNSVVKKAVFYVRKEIRYGFRRFIFKKLKGDVTEICF